MNRTRLMVLLMCLAVTTPVVVAEILDGGWRITGGALYNSRVKTHLNFNPLQFRGGRVALPTGGVTRKEALEAVQGVQGDTPTKRVYSADGKTYVDTVDYRTAEGGEEYGTWNVKAPLSSWNGDSFVLASAQYSESEVTQSRTGDLDLSQKDEASMPGLNLELSRNLWHSDEWKCGVDLSFGVSVFFKDRIYKGGSVAKSQVGVVRKGVAETTISPVSGVVEPDLADSEGYYGAGTFDGPGPVFNNPVTRLRSLSSTSYGNCVGYCADGDYWDVEMALCLRPYYDIYDWWRVYGTIGVAVSRAEFDLYMHRCVNGDHRRTERSYHSWDVYGIAGLGTMFRYRDFTLGCDFLARFLDDDLDIRDDIVDGWLSRGRWMFRLTLGYEF